MQSALERLSWRSFYITYSGFGCNLDMHQRRLGDLIYLHILPDSASQVKLFNFVGMVNKAFSDAGVKVNHPRKSLFHMTLLRANSSYPVDDMVEHLHDVGSTTIQVCCFDFNGQVVFAEDGCDDPQACNAEAVVAV
ncbi:Kif28p [Symbiodinium sp. CCMP2456]|nr:Kif28p [Symbiodinium sp. CCMP2456]